MMPHSLYFALPLLLIVAALYSSVGHGGASGYLAVLTFMGIAISPLVPVILTMNIAVAAISFLHFRKPAKFSFQQLLPFVVTSIPAAYLGGMHKANPTVFALILGLALLAAGIRLLGVQSKKRLEPFTRQTLWMIGLPVGALLGFVSGMIGIGGGVFLSPIIIFLGIADTRGSAAISSAFIVLNSLSGLAGAAAHWTVDGAIFGWMLAAGVTGALIGANWGALRARTRVLQSVLGVVLISASLKLLVSLIPGS